VAVKEPVPPEKVTGLLKLACASVEVRLTAPLKVLHKLPFRSSAFALKANDDPAVTDDGIETNWKLLGGAGFTVTV
jgi:hypothetical protein